MQEVVVSRPSLSQLLRLAWPIVIARSAQVVIGVTDSLLVAPLGEDALAATTTGAMNSFAFLGLALGTVFIVGSFAAQMTGRGDAAGARRFAHYGLVIALGAQLMAIAALPALGTMLGATGVSPSVRELIRGYMNIRLLSVGAAVGLEALGSYYGGIKNTVLPMTAQVLAMVLNVLLNWVLIGGHWGAPALGVRGSALASTLATTVAFLFLAFCFFRSREAPAGPMRLRELGRTLRFGLPVGFNFLIEMLAFLLFVNVVVGGLGTAELAATMAVIQLNSVAFMPAFALATAGSIFVGQAIGANQRDDVPATVRLTVLTTVGWQGLCAALYVIAPRVWLGPFVPPGAAEFLDLAAGLLMLSAVWQLFDGVAVAYVEALRAAGDTTFSLWARAGIGWLVFVPGAVVSTRVFHLRERGAALWLIVYLALLAVVMVLRFRSGRWRKLEIIEPQVEDDPASAATTDAAGGM
ncbi:MAG: MATE family efflux transporter [Polyangiaceae bacterium]